MIQSSSTQLYGAIEAGGTKFVCAIGSGPDDLREIKQFPTTTPQETLALCAEYFKDQQAKTPLHALGIGSFGPIGLNPKAPDYGFVLRTPKVHWSHTDVLSYFKKELGIPVIWDTDVNAAALAEWTWGAGQDTDPLVYITVGTGIGGGVLCNGKLLHGLLHPELGHMKVPHNLSKDPYHGNCPFHGDCLEGLASGPAIAARWGKPGVELAHKSLVWELEAEYLAAGALNIALTLSPQRIIFGGGVLQQDGLLKRIQQSFMDQLNGYIQHKSLAENIEQFIVAPGLGTQSGILGAIALAKNIS